MIWSFCVSERQRHVANSKPQYFCCQSRNKILPFIQAEIEKGTRNICHTNISRHAEGNRYFIGFSKRDYWPKISLRHFRPIRTKSGKE